MNEIKEAKGLYRDNRLLGTISLFDDDAVAICFKDKCYVTDKNQKPIYWIAQAWYSSLISDLQVRELHGKFKKIGGGNEVEEITEIIKQAIDFRIIFEELIKQ